MSDLATPVLGQYTTLKAVSVSPVVFGTYTTLAPVIDESSKSIEFESPFIPTTGFDGTHGVNTVGGKSC